MYVVIFNTKCSNLSMTIVATWVSRVNNCINMGMTTHNILVRNRQNKVNIIIELDTPVSYNITTGVFIYIKTAIFDSKRGKKA
jgi:hypothetical protein